MEKIKLHLQNHSNSFNSDFESVENSVNIISQYISATFDIVEGGISYKFD